MGQTCSCSTAQDVPVDQNKQATPRLMKQTDKLPSISEQVKLEHRRVQESQRNPVIVQKEPSKQEEEKKPKQVESQQQADQKQDGRLPPAEKDGPSYSRGIFGEKPPQNGRQFKHLEEEKLSPEEVKKRKADIIKELPRLDIHNSNKEDEQRIDGFQPIQDDPDHQRREIQRIQQQIERQRVEAEEIKVREEREVVVRQEEEERRRKRVHEEEQIRAQQRRNENERRRMQEERDKLEAERQAFEQERIENENKARLEEDKKKREEEEAQQKARLDEEAKDLELKVKQRNSRCSQDAGQKPAEEKKSSNNLNENQQEIQPLTAMPHMRAQNAGQLIDINSFQVGDDIKVGEANRFMEKQKTQLSRVLVLKENALFIYKDKIQQKTFPAKPLLIFPMIDVRKATHSEFYLHPGQRKSQAIHRLEILLERTYGDIADSIIQLCRIIEQSGGVKNISPPKRIAYPKVDSHGYDDQAFVFVSENKKDVLNWIKLINQHSEKAKIDKQD